MEMRDSERESGQAEHQTHLEPTDQHSSTTPINILKETLKVLE